MLTLLTSPRWQKIAVSRLLTDRSYREVAKCKVFALFHDLLKPAATMCKVLQEDELCVVCAIESFLKTKRSMEKLREIPFEELSTVKKVLERIEQEDRSVSYPAAELKLYDEGLEYIKSHHVQWVESIEACAFKVTGYR